MLRNQCFVTSFILAVTTSSAMSSLVLASTKWSKQQTRKQSRWAGLYRRTTHRTPIPSSKPHWRNLRLIHNSHYRQVIERGTPDTKLSPSFISLAMWSERSLLCSSFSHIYYNRSSFPMASRQDRHTFIGSIYLRVTHYLQSYTLKYVQTNWRSIHRYWSY